MNQPRVSTLCFLSARNLGDAVIHADFLKVLAASAYAARYVVWTFPAAAFLFADIPSCHVVVSNFPIGATLKPFLRGRVWSFLRAIAAIRRMQPTETLELVSDVRERTICQLLGARRNLSAAWSPGHLFRRHNRMGAFKPSKLVTIPASTTNLYASFDLVLDALLGSAHRPLNQGTDIQTVLARSRAGHPLRIGIHPFASSACKLWPDAHWHELLQGLRRDHPDARLILFGAPADREQLERMRSAAGVVDEIFTASLPEFKRRMEGIDLLVGLDSFSVHLARSQGAATIVLVGPNDPRLFTPPGGVAITHPGRCPHQPCGGKPRCEGTPYQYACMHDISPEQVLGLMRAPATITRADAAAAPRGRAQPSASISSANRPHQPAPSRP